MSSAVIFQIQSALILFLMHLGVYIILKKRNRTLHAKIMGVVIAWDLLLVLQIELTRGAVAKAMQAPVNPMILNIHVSMAITCVLLYFVMIYSGRKLLKGDKSSLKLHKFSGVVALTLRSLVFFTSFLVVN